MTIAGAGGIEFDGSDAHERFRLAYKRLDPTMRDRVKEALRKLYQKPIPAGVDFEKLKGYSNPDIYTIHVDGNFKISLEVERRDGECLAVLRNVGTHKEIDRSP